MKCSTLLLNLAVFAVAASFVHGESDAHASHDGEGHSDPDCATFNVTDSATCTAFCGEGYTAQFEVKDAHKDSAGGLHVDVLTGMDCECETTGGEETEEKHCAITYDFPTCESSGLGECGGNATSTCSELYTSLGLEGANTVCYHVEGEAHGTSSPDRVRFLAEEGGADSHDDEEKAYTMCFCGAEMAGDGIVSCADAGWEDEHAHDSSDESAGSSVSVSLQGYFLASVAVVAVAFM